MCNYQWISVFVLAAVAALVNGAVAEDSVTFVAKPNTLHFNSKQEKIDSVQLANVILTSMGFTRNGGWSGAFITSPFNPPRVVVGMRVRDSAHFDSLTGNQFPLNENLKWDELFSILVERGEKRLDNLRSDYVFVPEENAVTQSVSVMDKLAKDVVENGTISPLIYFADMTRSHLTTQEMDESAKKLVESVEALNGIMILVKSSDITPHHSRRTRQAPKEDKNPMNLADDVNEDYPIVFNIILFISITLLLALIAISVAISTMDPGRDSLIYRVTSAQRFKKDN